MAKNNQSQIPTMGADEKIYLPITFYGKEARIVAALAKRERMSLSAATMKIVREWSSMQPGHLMMEIDRPMPAITWNADTPPEQDSDQAQK